MLGNFWVASCFHWLANIMPIDRGHKMLGESFALFTYLTKFMQQIPSWTANNFPASQEFPRILWNQRDHYNVRHSQPFFMLPRQVDTSHPLKSDVSKCTLISSSKVPLDLPSCFFSSGFFTKNFVCIFSSTKTSHVALLHPLFGSPKNI